MKNITHLLVLTFLFSGSFLVTSYAQMSKDLVKEETKAPIENMEGEPELLSYKERLKLLIAEEPMFLNNTISNDEIARLLRTSTSVVESILQSEFGQDYETFINSRRIKAALLLLSHDDFQDLDYDDKEVMNSVLFDVAQQSGYVSTKHFIKQFKKHEGMHPEEYIEENVME